MLSGVDLVSFVPEVLLQTIKLMCEFLVFMYNVPKDSKTTSSFK